MVRHESPAGADRGEAYVYPTLESQAGEGIWLRDEETSGQAAHYNNGGLMAYVSGVFAAGMGPNLEADYPYQAANGTSSTAEDWTLDDSDRFILTYELENSSILPNPSQRDAEGNYVYNAYGTLAIKDEILSGRPVVIDYHADRAVSPDAIYNMIRDQAISMGFSEEEAEIIKNAGSSGSMTEEEFRLVMRMNLVLSTGKSPSEITDEEIDAMIGASTSMVDEGDGEQMTDEELALLAEQEAAEAAALEAAQAAALEAARQKAAELGIDYDRYAERQQRKAEASSQTYMDTEHYAQYTYDQDAMTTHTVASPICLIALSLLRFQPFDLCFQRLTGWQLLHAVLVEIPLCLTLHRNLRFMRFQKSARITETLVFREHILRAHVADDLIAHFSRFLHLPVQRPALFQKLTDMSRGFIRPCPQLIDIGKPMLAQIHDMSKQVKIRRPIIINGERRWISAASEQEYAEKCAKALMETHVIDTQTKAVNRKKHVFRDYAYRWFEVFSKPNIEDVTAITYERQLKLHICPVLGEKNVEDITPLDVQAMFNRMENASKETKNKAKIVLNMILEQAVEDELLRRNPLASKSIRINGASSKPTEPYSVEQMRYLVQNIEQVQKPQDRAYLALQALHPLRLEEVLGLKGADVEGSIIHIRRAVTHPDRNKPIVKDTKTNGSVCDLDLVEQVKKYIPDTAPDDFILGGAKPLSYQQVRKMCERIERDTGFGERITPIRFRTTVLTDMYDQTKDLKQTQKAAGHSNASTTMKHYVKGRAEHANTAAPVAAAYGLI